MTIDHCYTCGHSIYAHSGRPDTENDACTLCACVRMVRLVTFTNGHAVVVHTQKKDSHE